MIEHPYLALFALLEKIQDPFQSGAELITDWCSRFGLLGILPHRVHTITLPARWGGTTNFAEPIWRKLHRLQPNQLVPVVTQHFRSSTGWHSRKMAFPPVRDGKCLSGGIVTDQDLPPECPRPSVIWTKTDEVIPSSSPLDVLGPFFPDAPADFKYPMPLSAEFWPLYCEPIHEFWNVALALYKVVKAIAELKQKPLTEFQGIEAALLLGNIERLNAFASPVGVSLGPARDGSKLVQRWAGPSLISSLSHMALLTLAQCQVHCCATCDGVFVSSAWQAKHCSPRCRETAAKRELRNRQRTAVAKRRDGESIESIARKLGSTVATVKGWLQKQSLR